MVCKVNVFLLMCKLFWQKIGETYWWPLDCRLKAIPDLLKDPKDV